MSASDPGELLLTKPMQLDQFESLVKRINDFRLTKVRSPQQRQSG